MTTKRSSWRLIALLPGVMVALALLQAEARAQTGPSITRQPASQTILAGGNAALSVAVSGTGPFNYQWRFNGTNLPNFISTVAGNGLKGYAGGQGGAAGASLNLPSGLAADAAGNIFIADTQNNRIRKVDAGGVITTVAGAGSMGYSGDGGSATNASLAAPSGVAVDTSGNLFIADFSNGRIRKVDVHGIITTVAGDGSQAYSGDGGAATNAALNYPFGVAVDAAGNLFVADTLNHRIRKVDAQGVVTTVAGNGSSGFSGDGGAATNAGFNYPFGVAVDSSENLYIADWGGGRVRKVDTNGVVTTVAGNGSEGYSGDGGAATGARLNGPTGVAMDGFGNLFIADSANNRIRKVDPHGIITTAAGGGSAGDAGDGGAATNASLNGPFGVAVDAAGNLLVADENNSRVREVALGGLPKLTLVNLSASTAGEYEVLITSPYGSVTSAAATLSVVYPPALTSQPVSQTNLAGASMALSVGVSGTAPFSYQWQFDGTNVPNVMIFTVAGRGTPLLSSNGTVSYYSGDRGPATNASLYEPYGAAVDASGNLFIADDGNNRIRKVDSAGVITTVAGSGEAGYDGDGGAATNAGLDGPSGVAVNASGNLFIADSSDFAFREVEGDGTIITLANLSGPAVAVAVDASGNLFMTDYLGGRILKEDNNRIITTVAGRGSLGNSGDGGAATNASFYEPFGVALDASGNLFIADAGNNRIRKVNAGGVITTVAGSGPGGPLYGGYSGDGGPATNATLHFPRSAAVDACGNLFIADFGNQRVRKVDVNGVITTVAGNGEEGYSGDGGAATNARISYPSGVAVDAAGNLFIADTLNNRIREVALGGLPFLSLTNLSAASAGDYQVIVTSQYGSVTSAVANLTVQPPGQAPGIVMSGPVIAGTNLVLGFRLSQGSLGSFTLLQTASLTGQWTTNTAALLTTNAQAVGYQFSLPAPGAIEFYRVRSP